MSSLSTRDLRRDEFEALVDRVYEPLQRYARRRTDAESASDVVAEVLLVLWRRLDDVPADALLPWCYGVARRVLANTRRGDARRLRLVDRLTHEAVEGSATAVTDTAEHDLTLHAALQRLRPADREVLFLWAWEQLEAREIAIVLDMTPNAASIRLHRAKRRLRQMVDAPDAVTDGKTGVTSGHTGPGDSKET